MPTLENATVQELQLELIRRSTHNAFNGRRVHISLLKHRELWTAVLLDRPGVSSYQSGSLLTAGLIKLRDLPYNHWNADTLFILTPTPETARALAKVAEDEEWCGEILLHEDRKETDAALGTGGHEYGLLSIWWD